MSDAAQTFTRVKDSDLPKVSLDYLDEQAALLELNPRQYVAWRRLLLHLHKYGELPMGFKALAGICKVGPRAFEAMAPTLGHHFDRDPQGRWTHRDVLEARGDRPVVPALEVAASVSDLSAKRSAAGIEGNRKRWGKDRQHLQVVDGDKADLAASPASETGDPIANDADPIANGIANGVDLPTGFAATLRSVATESPSPLTSPSDGLSDSGSKEEGEGHGASPDARDVDRKTANTVPPLAAAAIANPVAKLLASGSPTAIANATLGDVEGPPSVRDALPYTVGEAFTADSPPVPSPSDEAIIVALRGAGGGKIPATLLTSQGIEPIRELIQQRCDLKGHIVPAVLATVPCLSEPLKSFRASFLRQAALAKRDEALRAADAEATTFVRIYKGTAQAQALAAHKGHQLKFICTDNDGRRYTFAPSEWPPGHAPPPTP